MSHIRGRILLIDDDNELLQTLVQLVSDSHETVAFGDAREALQMLKSNSEFHLIICDMMMPKMGGMEFYDRIKAEMPELCSRILFLTGGSFTKKTTDFLNQQEIRSCEKPIQADDLMEHIQTLVNEIDPSLKKAS